jgi:hypothetical protein
MADPWEIPPIPDHGDASENMTHIARSRALDAWELLEVALSVLDEQFARAIGSRARYGSGKIFVQRLNTLERHSSKYFIQHPDQDEEAEFDILACYIRKYSNRRHDIAHGVVQPLGHTNIIGIDFGLLPAAYTFYRERDPFPEYIYNSEIMTTFNNKLSEFWSRVTDFRNHLFPSVP